MPTPLTDNDFRAAGATLRSDTTFAPIPELPTRGRAGAGARRPWLLPATFGLAGVAAVGVFALAANRGESQAPAGSIDQPVPSVASVPSVGDSVAPTPTSIPSRPDTSPLELAEITLTPEGLTICEDPQQQEWHCQTFERTTGTGFSHQIASGNGSFYVVASVSGPGEVRFTVDGEIHESTNDAPGESTRMFGIIVLAGTKTVVLDVIGGDFDGAKVTLSHENWANLISPYEFDPIELTNGATATVEIDRLAAPNGTNCVIQRQGQPNESFNHESTTGFEWKMLGQVCGLLRDGEAVRVLMSNGSDAAVYYTLDANREGYRAWFTPTPAAGIDRIEVLDDGLRVIETFEP